MPVLDCKKDKNNNFYFFWLEDSKKERIQHEGDYINIFEMLKQALSQAETKPGYQNKSYLISQKFSKLLNEVPDLKEPISQWVKNISKKTSKELSDDLEIIRSTKLSNQPGHDSNGHSALHKAILSKNIPEINKLLAVLSDSELRASDTFPVFIASTTRAGKPFLAESIRNNQKSYLHYLVENLPLDEFKKIWEIHGDRLKELDSLFPDNSIINNLFYKQQYDYADFLVSQGLSLNRRGSTFDRVTFGFYETSVKNNPIEHINRFLNILEKQSDKTSSELNLGCCFNKIVERGNQAALQHAINHPYILTNQAIIDKAIKVGSSYVYSLSKITDKSIWEYFLTRRPPSQNEIKDLISHTILVGNLGLLLHLEKKGYYQINENTLIAATKLEASDVIHYLIKEKKIDPCKPITIDQKVLPSPICAMPKGSESTKVMDAYAKAMGIDAFCKMMLAGSKSPLEYMSGTYGIQQGSFGVNRANSVPTLTAKNYIQEKAPDSIRIPFNFGELLTSYISDEVYRDLLCASYYDERCSHFKDTLDHFILKKDILLIYGPHKQALNDLEKLIKLPNNQNQPKILSDKGVQEVLTITMLLQAEDSQIEFAKTKSSQQFKKQASAPRVESLDESTKKELIENPNKMKEINARREKANLPLLGEQLNRDLSTTTVQPVISAAWYMPQPVKAPIQQSGDLSPILPTSPKTPIIKSEVPQFQQPARPVKNQIDTQFIRGNVSLNYMDYTKDTGRTHYYNKLSSEKNFQQNKTLRNKYGLAYGDNLKSRILHSFKDRINRAKNREEFLELKEELLSKDNPETNVLRQAQGAIFSFFSCFGLQTTSMDALEDMLAQREIKFPSPDTKPKN